MIKKMMNAVRFSGEIVFITTSMVAVSGCSSTPYKTQAYAQEQTSRTMEYDYSVVWKGIKEALAEYHVKESSEEDGHAETDWAYSTSNDKYMDVVVNQQPRRKYLQTRYRFKVDAKKQMIGVLVDVKAEEEVETLKADGSFNSWSKVGTPGTSRPHELLMLIERKIQSGRHI